MSTYLFILGKDPRLSLAELYAAYPDALFHEFEDAFVVMDTSNKLNQATFDRLGGVLKMGELSAQVEKSELSQALIEALLSDHQSGKLQYGVSVYGLPEGELKTLLIGLKKRLKSASISSRFANQNFKNLSVAQKKGLKGPEILICQSGTQYFIGKVTATQDIDAYSKRDYDKPFRSMKVGMLPPKLAQILVNLTGVEGAIWDPFCGGGVLVMEGLLSGRDMLGSDINTRTLEGAQRNVEWVRQEFNLSSQAELFEHDATHLVPQKKFEAIAFEGYLGVPQTRMGSEREIRPLISELDRLYIEFFHQLKIAQFKGSIVAALPFFRVRDRAEMGLTCINEIREMGFELESLLPQSRSLSLKYARADQLVGREVFRFKLNL